MVMGTARHRNAVTVALAHITDNGIGDFLFGDTKYKREIIAGTDIAFALWLMTLQLAQGVIGNCVI